MEFLQGVWALNPAAAAAAAATTTTAKMASVV